MGPSREDFEQDVYDIFLTHKDPDEKVRNDSVGNLSGIRLVRRRKADEYGYVGRKGEAEKPSVNGEEQVANISDWFGVLLLDIFIIEITLPIEGFFFVRDMLRRGTESSFGDGNLRLRSGREIDDLGFFSGRFWSCDRFTTVSEKWLSAAELKESWEKIHSPFLARHLGYLD